MTVRADHHIFGFEISVNVACMVEHLQWCEHLIADKSDGFEVEIFIFFLKDVVNTFLKLFHDEERVCG